MKLKVSHESPISILEESKQYNDYDYALVHLFEKYPEYYIFFKKSLLEGREVLLDNSIFELGTAFDADKFANAIKDLNPTYYIVPDVLENGIDTVKNFHNWLSKYNNLPGIKIGVVQGKTYDELCECYKYMSDFADYIALSFNLSYYVARGRGSTKLERWCNGRKALIQDWINDGIWNWDKPHHLLGCSLITEWGWYVNKNIYNIRSADSSNPVMAGIKGMRYSGNLGLQTKPEGLLADHLEVELTQDQKDDILYNTKCVKEIIGR